MTPNTSNPSSEEILSKAKDLSQIVASVPQLERSKRQLEMHTNICRKILEEVQERSLDKFYQAEYSSIFSKSSKSTEEVLELLSSEKGSMEDKLRMALIHLLSQEDFDTPHFNSFKENLSKIFSTASSSSKEGRGEGLDWRGVMDYLWKEKENDKFIFKSSSTTPSRENSSISNLVNKTMNYIRSGNSKMPRICSITNEIVSLSSDSPSHKTFLYFDPKVSSGGASGSGSGGNSVPRKTTPFTSVIVFVVGGGSYAEYNFLRDSLKDKASLIYGSTDLPPPSLFLQQINSILSTK